MSAHTGLLASVLLVVTACGDGAITTTSVPSGSDTSAPATTSAASPTTTAATTAPTATFPWNTVDPAALGTEWRRVGMGEGLEHSGQLLARSLAVGEALLISVGYDRTWGDEDAAVWTSDNGTDWLRLPHDPDVFGGAGNQGMNAVVAGGPGFVAVGYDDIDGDWDFEAAVWTSPDGFTWTRVPHDPAAFGGFDDQIMNDVVVGGPGLVAVGYDESPGGWNDNAAVWTSPDGISWSRVPNSAVFGGDHPQRMTSVVATGSGLVAVGYDVSTGTAAVWASSDGITWERVPDPSGMLGGPGSQRMQAVALGGPGLIAVGIEQPPRDTRWHPAVWTSVDGATWVRVPHDDAMVGGGEGAMMTAVAVTDSAIAAVGVQKIADVWRAAIWVSSDGVTWSPVILDAAAHGDGEGGMMAILAWGPGLIAVGQIADGARSAAAAWLSPAPN